MRKLWKSLYLAYSERIQIRLTLYFLFILIPLVGVSLFANFRSTEILEGQTGERTENSLLSVLDHVDLTLQNLEHLSELIMTDDSIKPMLLEANGIPLVSDLYHFHTIMDRLANIASINGSLKEISILHTSSGTLLSSQYGARKPDFEEEPWYQAAAAANGETIVYLPQNGDDGIFGANTVSFIQLMELQSLEDPPNILILSMDRSKLLEMIQGVRPTPQSSVYLYAPGGRLVTGTGPVFPADRWKGLGAGEVSKTEEGMLVWRMQSDESGWSVVMAQPENELYESSRQLSGFTNGIIVISIILALLISFGVYRWISAPLGVLLSGMKQMRMRKFDTRLPNRRSDEFGALTNAFNQLIADQQMLINDVYEHQLQLSKTELKFLHSQINPHFLYNTLDSIYWTAKNYEADEISEMVLNLSRFFRLSLGKGRDTFTVGETIEHLTYYLKVQQFRFMDQFSVEFRIDERTTEIRVLKLLLQPIVENAILHGLEKRSAGGLLVVSSGIEGGMLCLKVSDNGIGIAEERLAYIRGEIGRFDREPHFIPGTLEGEELFGLRNVIGRMKLYYGQEARLRMESRRGEGTAVELRIPLERLEEKPA